VSGENASPALRDVVRERVREALPPAAREVVADPDLYTVTVGAITPALDAIDGLSRSLDAVAESHRGDLNAHETTIAALSSELDAHDAAIAALSQRLDAQENAINDLHREVVALRHGTPPSWRDVLARGLEAVAGVVRGTR